MNFQSVKTRFMGSYLLLLLLFVVQIPIVYVLIGGMSERYAQVDAAGSLRKRAVDVTETLTRHISSGNEALEQKFQGQKAEYSKVIESLRTGTLEMSAITEPEILASLSTVDARWQEVRDALDEGMEFGDAFRESKASVEASTAPMVDALNEFIASLEDLGDSKYLGLVNTAGYQRMRTVNMSYLLERYFMAYEDRAEVKAEINQTVTGFETTIGELKAALAGISARGVKGEKILSELRDVEALWLDRKGDIVAGIEANDAYRAQVDSLVNTHTPEIVTLANGLTKGITETARSAAMTGILTMVVSVLFSACIAGVFMWFTNSQVLRPLTRIKEVVEDFARGNLGRRTGVRVKLLGRELDDEITTLGRSVDQMAEEMSSMIGRITDSSNHLASASEQLSTSSTQITEGANRQSSQTDQVATAMEEMNATVIEVAKNSQQASESARNASHIATTGGDVVTEAIGAMKEVADSTRVTADTIKKLGKSSEEIGAIISVINDIADQTNLLALNAAIEAARAGEQGRGFAVVADEVRKLAERTTKATKEISGMIESIQTETSSAVTSMDEGTVKVENGVELANQAGESLQQIVSGVEQVTDMIGHIATSAEEQSATTEEITQNMDAIAEVAKGNVTAIGEVSNATDELARLATELKGLVSKFTIEKVSGQGPGSPDLRVLTNPNPPRRSSAADNPAHEDDTYPTPLENV